MLNWLSGKKTYIIAGSAVLFNVVSALHWVPPSIDQVKFLNGVNWLLGFAGMAALRSGVASQVK